MQPEGEQPTPEPTATAPDPMLLHQPPKDDMTPPAVAEGNKPASKPEEPKKPKQKKPAPKSSNLATVITLAIIVVLGLAALAVYAYMKSK